MTKFETFNLKSELLNSLEEMNFIDATEVQEQAIPLALDNTDLVVRSKTGTGKTGAFLIPIIQKSDPKERISSLIITPTRELALQVYKVADKMGQKSKIRATVVYGGASIDNQIRNIRKGTNIIIGTPGRLIDLMKRGELDISKLKFLILDEADVMLDLGFIEDIEYIISKTPSKKQSMLFSATVPERVLNLAKRYMKNPQSLRIGEGGEMTVKTISHSYALSANSSKIATLLAYINEYNPSKSIIFSETKRGADYLYDVLAGQGFNVTVMHGDLTQAQREKSLQAFRQNAQFLIATNVAARGLDIMDVSDVINFDTPSEPYVYVHRVGRSARMGNNGSAFTIIERNEMDLIRKIEHSVKIHMSRIELNQEPYMGLGHSFSSGGRNRHNNGGERDHGRKFGNQRRGPRNQNHRFAGY